MDSQNLCRKLLQQSKQSELLAQTKVTIGRCGEGDLFEKYFGMRISRTGCLVAVPHPSGFSSRSSCVSALYEMLITSHNFLVLCGSPQTVSSLRVAIHLLFMAVPRTIIVSNTLQAISICWINERTQNNPNNHFKSSLRQSLSISSDSGFPDADSQRWRNDTHDQPCTHLSVSAISSQPPQWGYVELNILLFSGHIYRVT